MCTVTLTLFVLKSRCVESNGFLILPVDSQRLTGVAPKISKSTEAHKERHCQVSWKHVAGGREIVLCSAHLRHVKCVRRLIFSVLSILKLGALLLVHIVM